MDGKFDRPQPDADGAAVNDARDMPAYRDTLTGANSQ